MKALDEYFLMVVFTLLLNEVHVSAHFILIWTEKHGSERDIQPGFDPWLGIWFQCCACARVAMFARKILLLDLQLLDDKEK